MNFLNLEEHQFDDRIYRIFPLQRFEDILRDKRNTLTNPSLWADNYENLALTADVNIVKGTSMKLNNELGKSIYCQCWSLTKESIPMWEIYSNDNKSVQVSTTIRKLFNSLYEDYGKPYDTFIGKVLYKNQSDIENLIKINSFDWINDRSGVEIGKSLLLKRDIFVHENEVRLIYNSFGKVENKYIQYDINPNELFDEVIFDSRLNESDYEKNKKSIIDLGWENTIVKSELYNYPLNFNI